MWAARIANGLGVSNVLALYSLFYCIDAVFFQLWSVEPMMKINESPATVVVTKQFRDNLNENVPFQFQIIFNYRYWMVYVIKNIYEVYRNKAFLEGTSVCILYHVYVCM